MNESDAAPPLHKRYQDGQGDRVIPNVPQPCVRRQHGTNRELARAALAPRPAREPVCSSRHVSLLLRCSSRP